MDISKQELEHHREVWSAVAKNNNWYCEPFFIQVWVNQKGEITDSVSIRGLEKDYVISNLTDEMIEIYQVK